MLYKAANSSQILGLLPEFCLGGVISLQYADDTLIFLKNDITMAQNLKWILTLYEHIYGMKINYHKSDRRYL